MSTAATNPNPDRPEDSLEEAETIDRALLEMELLYRSRCVQAPLGSNVTVREIDEDGKHV